MIDPNRILDKCVNFFLGKIPQNQNIDNFLNFIGPRRRPGKKKILVRIWMLSHENWGSYDRFKIGHFVTRFFFAQMWAFFFGPKCVSRRGDRFETYFFSGHSLVKSKNHLCKKDRAILSIYSRKKGLLRSPFFREYMASLRSAFLTSTSRSAEVGL